MAAFFLGLLIGLILGSVVGFYLSLWAIGNLLCRDDDLARKLKVIWKLNGSR